MYSSNHYKFLIVAVLLILLVLCSSSFAVRESEAIESLLNRLDSKKPSPSVQELAAKGVLRRLLPTHLSSFDFKIITKDACGGKSCFQICNRKNSSRESPEIKIKGTTAVDIISGLHWYLKYWCGAHVSWNKTGGMQLGSVPKSGSLPPVKDDGVKIQRPVPWNYNQNVVTSSYSYVWWDWERWEKEIDWMALQGVNLPLAFTGQETIWEKVFAEFNVTKSDLNNFFGGPAFLAWARMGNLHGWGGPLTQNWLQVQLILQKKILARMLELGMIPVLPSFSGNVPAALKEIFPTANISRLGDWNTVNGDPRWCCTYLLDPSDPLFVKIGEAFIKQQIKEYGDVTDIYSCDTFNENSPPTNDPAYISTLGSAVYNAMSKADKDAVWLMQGWLFYSDSSFWKPPQMKDHNKDYIVEFPDWDPYVNRNLVRTQPNGRLFLLETGSSLPLPHLWYNNQDAIDALKLFLDVGTELSKSLTFRYDLVDLTRQCLSKLANEVYLNVIQAFLDENATALSFHTLKFLKLIKDIDKLLAADDNFLLGTWLESAKHLALNADEMKQYEWNARTQVTMWYDNTKHLQSKLHDYANKFWNGLLEEYYLPRASMYFTHLLKSLKENKDFKLDDWRKEWIAFSNKWQAGMELYPVKAQGDALSIAKDLYQKYFG